MILGQIIITDVQWTAADAIGVTFASEHVTRCHQLYLGRRLVAETVTADERMLTCGFIPSRWPDYLWIVAIDDAERGIDNGSALPPRPYNRARLQFNNSGWTGDPHEVDVNIFQLFRGTVPGGEIDYTQAIATRLVDAPGPFTLESDPLPGSGEWNIGVRGMDEVGNVGTEAETTLRVNAIPPDFDEPFAVSVAGGVGTITLTIPED